MADEIEVVRLYQTGEFSMHSLALQFEVSDSAVKRALYRVTKPTHSSLK